MTLNFNTNKTYIIAEAGVNHNNDLSLAFKMIDLAKKSGADAIKFQTFKADKIQLKNSKKPNYQKKIKHLNYYEIIKSLETNYLDQKKIFEYCKKKNILFLSTPYDEESADQLEWFYHLTGGETWTDFFAIRPTDYAKAGEDDNWGDIW